MALLARLECEQLWEDLPGQVREAVVQELARVMLKIADRRAGHEAGQSADTADAP